MSANEPPPPRPAFIPGAGGRLFVVYRPPAGPGPDHGDILFLPPFAEEMNRSRRMATLLARALAGIGYGTLVPDLHGTGDSEGAFADARWDIWRGDVRAAVDWLRRERPRPLGVVGLRLGAALATDLADTLADSLERIVLWQPVTNGQLALTQFLRIRLATTMDAGAAGRESTRDLRARLAADESVEVAGYELHPELARAIDAVRLERLGARCTAPVTWFEVASEAGHDPGPASQRVIDAWRAKGLEVTAATVPGEPFWTLQETTLAPALIEATCRLFEKDAP